MSPLLSMFWKACCLVLCICVTPLFADFVAQGWLQFEDVKGRVNQCDTFAEPLVRHHSPFSWQFLLFASNQHGYWRTFEVSGRSPRFSMVTLASDNSTLLNCSYVMNADTQMFMTKQFFDWRQWDDFTCAVGKLRGVLNTIKVDSF